MKSDLQRVGIFLAVISIIIGLISLTTGVMKDPITDVIKTRNEIVCSAVVDGSIIGDATLESQDCINQNTKCIPLLSVSPLSFISNEGKIVFDAGDVVKTSDFKVSRFGGVQTFRQKLCTNQDNVVIKLINEDGKQTTSVNVEVQ